MSAFSVVIKKSLKFIVRNLLFIIQYFGWSRMRNVLYYSYWWDASKIVMMMLKCFCYVFKIRVGFEWNRKRGTLTNAGSPQGFSNGQSRRLFVARIVLMFDSGGAPSLHYTSKHKVLRSVCQWGSRLNKELDLILQPSLFHDSSNSHHRPSKF